MPGAKKQKIDWIYVESGEIVEAYTLEEDVARFQDLYFGTDLHPCREDVVTYEQYIDRQRNV
jgi:hypothetical protein